MYLFTFLFIPICFLFYCLNFKKSNGNEVLKSKFLVALTAFLFGAVFSAVVKLVLFDESLYDAGVFKYIMCDWRRIALEPALFYVLYFLWSKDSAETRILNFTFFMIPFFCVYAPVYVFSLESPSSLFAVFAVPVLIFCFILNMADDLKRFFKSFREKRVFKCILFGILFAAESFVPSLFRVMWKCGAHILILTALLLLLCAFCAYRYGVFQKKNGN